MKAINYSGAVHAQLRRERRAMGGQSPRMFTQTYLTTGCWRPLSRMHCEVFAALAELVEHRAGRLAIAAPRGHAKSTIVSLAYVLWCVLYDKEKLVLLVSATKEQVITLMIAIKDELQQNSFLIEDFPEICHPTGAAGQSKPWRDTRIQLPNGAMISAFGEGQALRGLKNKSNRPGLIIVDDIEDDELVLSEEQRQKLDKWFSGTLLHAGHPGTNVIAVGTILHHDSLLANLINPQGRNWTGLKYKAIEQPSERPDLWETWMAIFRRKEEYEGRSGPDAARAFFESDEDEMKKGSQVLWPELEDYYTLMVMREREGRASFQAEKQNEPLDPQLCIFAEANFQYWDDEYGDVESLLDALGRNGDFVGACDPSLGRRTGRGDYTAIVILFVPEGSSTAYVIAADIARRTPDQAIEQIILYAKMYPFSSFVVESNNFQALMVDDLVRRSDEAGMSLPVYRLDNRSNKQSRIASLEPEITQGRVKLCRRHQLLLEQLQQFPLGVHDDGPDALEMAVTVSRQIEPKNEGTSTISISCPPHVPWENRQY